MATEPGDLYYCKYNSIDAIYGYGHVYSKQELIEDVINSGLFPGNVKIMSIEQPYILSENKTYKYIDTILSIFLSLNLQFYPFNSSDTIAKNIYIVAYKNIHNTKRESPIYELYILPLIFILAFINNFIINSNQSI
jgi:hypothetical protein